MREENERKGKMRMNLNVIHAPEKRTSNIFNNAKEIFIFIRAKNTLLSLFVVFRLWLKFVAVPFLYTRVYRSLVR
jgi:hypothetical protein